MSVWKECTGSGIAKYKFTGQASNQLSLEIGDEVHITQECENWYRGWLKSAPGSISIFPKNHVKFTAAPAAAPAAPVKVLPPHPSAPPSAAPTMAVPTPGGAPRLPSFLNTQGPPPFSPTGAAGGPPPFPSSSANAGPPPLFVPSAPLAMPPPFAPAGATAAAAGVPSLLPGGSPPPGPPASPPPGPPASPPPGPPESPPPGPPSTAFSAVSIASPGPPVFPPLPPVFMSPASPAAAGAGAHPAQGAATPLSLSSLRSGHAVPGTPLNLASPHPPSVPVPPPFSPLASPAFAPAGTPAGAAPPTYNPAVAALPTYVPTGDAGRAKQAKAAAVAAALEAETLGQYMPTVHCDNREEPGGFLLPRAREGGATTDANTDPLTMLDALRLVDADLGASVAYRGVDAPATAPDSTGAVPAPHIAAAETGPVAHLRAQQHDAAAALSPAEALSRRYQLYLDVKVCIFSVGEETDLHFALYSYARREFVTGEYIVSLPPPGLPEHMRVLGKIKTVFQDIVPADLADDVWLVCKIFRRGSLIYEPKDLGKPSASASAAAGKSAADKATTCRRCFGAAVVAVTPAQLTRTPGKEYEPPASSLTIFTPTNEMAFPTFHDTLIAAAKEGDLLTSSKEFEPAPRAKGIALGLTLLEGGLPSARAAHKALLKDVPATQKPAFARAWTPAAEPRNDLYVKLVGGSFSQDKKSSARNIEVRVRAVQSSTLADIPASVYTGVGAEVPPNVYSSGVYYHSNTPEFNETALFSVPHALYPDAHLLFEFWHVSTTAKKSAPFASAFFPLTDPATGAVVRSQSHTLTTYRPFNAGEKYIADAATGKIPARKETFTFETRLRSSVLSEHAPLHTLINWASVSAGALSAAVAQLASPASTVPLEALARLLPTVVAALCAAIGSPTVAAQHDALFQLLLFVLARLAPDHSHPLRVFCGSLLPLDRAGTVAARLSQLIVAAVDDQAATLASVAAAALSSSAGSPPPPPPGTGSYAPGAGGDAPNSAINPLLLASANSSNRRLSMNPAGAGSGRLASRSLASRPPALALGSGSFNLGSGITVTGGSSAGTGPGGALSPLGYNTIAGGAGVRLQVHLEEPESPSHLASPSAFGGSGGGSGGSGVAGGTPTPSSEPLDLDPTLRLGRALPYLVLLTLTAAVGSAGIAADETAPLPASAAGPVTSAIDAASRFIGLDFDLVSAVMRSPAAAQGQAAALTALPVLCEHLRPRLGAAATAALAARWLATTVTPASAGPLLTSARALVSGITAPHPLPAAAAGGALPFTSSVRTLVLQPPTQLARVLPSPVLAGIFSVLVSLAGKSLSLAVQEQSLDELLPAVALLQHLYARAAPHSSLRARLAANNADATVDAAADSTDASASAVSVSALAPALPALAAAVHAVLRACPGIPLLRSEAGSPHLQLLPASDATVRAAYVDVLLDTSMLLFAVVDGTPEPELHSYLTTLPTETLAPLLLSLLSVATTHVTHSSALVPPAWVQPQWFLLRGAVTVLRAAARVLRTHCTGARFDPAVWGAWLRLALAVRLSRALAVDELPPVRARYVQERYGADLRRGVPELLFELWQSLTDELKLSLAPGLVDHLVAALVIANAGVRLSLLDVFFDLLCARHRVAGDFSEIERLAIDALYEVAHVSQAAGETAMQLLQSACASKFAAAGGRLGADGTVLLAHMQDIFRLILSLFSLPDTPEYLEDRAAVALRLIAYIESSAAAASAAGTGAGMHARYLQLLVELHSKGGNHVEAAVTQLQQAKLLEWSDAPLEACGDLPAASSRDRKERLLRSAVAAFSKAQEWERASECGDLLRHYYQHLVYDYTSLASLLRGQAEHFMSAVTEGQRRHYSTYFRVVFYGDFAGDAATVMLPDGGAALLLPSAGDTASSAGAEYVVKGVEMDQIMPFTDRLKRRFPGAHFAMTAKPAPEVLAAHKQVISVIALLVPTAEHSAAILARVPDLPPLSRLPALAAEAVPPTAPLVPTPMYVANHKNNHGLRVFEYERVLRLTSAAPNEFRDMWKVRTHIVTAEPFPSNRRRIPVVRRVEENIPPVVTAIEAIEKKTRDIELLTATVAQAPSGPVDTNPLSSGLSGAIDAAVNGGTAKYIEAFFTPLFFDPSTFSAESEKENPAATIAERRLQLQELKGALSHQQKVLKDGLDVFGARCNASLRGLYTHLVSSHEKTVKETAPLFV